MKLKLQLRMISFLLLVVVLVPSVLTGYLSTYAEDFSAESALPNEDLQVITTGLDALTLAGVDGIAMLNHGGNQNRVVSVSSGVYLGVMVTPNNQYTKDLVQATMIRVNADGTSETLCTDFIAGGTATVSIMADKNEDIWMYSGWEVQGQQIVFKLWHYDVSENTTTAYTTEQRLVGDQQGFGYAIAMMDAKNDKIFAITPAGDTPGWFGWCEFDITTKEWKPFVTVETEYRYCYNFAYPDGNGGFFSVTQRDIKNWSVRLEIGMSVSDAMRTYRSRKLDADYMWDELHIIHIPDPSVAEFEDLIVEEATYDVLNGVYPNIKNGGNGDAFVDSNGNLHVLFTSDDDGIAGVYINHKVFDISEGFKEISSNRMTFLYGDNTNYCARMYEDLAGNVYIFALPTVAKSQIEIWKSTDELNTQFKLVHNETLNGAGDTTGGGMIMANNRNNSTPANIATVMIDMAVSSYASWYVYSIDLSSFGD